jgi:hypothetical protein
MTEIFSKEVINEQHNSNLMAKLTPLGGVARFSVECVSARVSSYPRREGCDILVLASYGQPVGAPAPFRLIILYIHTILLVGMRIME